MMANIPIRFVCKCGNKFHETEYRREKSFNTDKDDYEYTFVSYCPRCGRMARKKV